MNLRKPTLIGLTGYAGVGKTTAATLLAEIYKEPDAVVSIATPLKKGCKALGWDGNKDEIGRKLLQTVGTDVCRRFFGEDHWLNTLAKEVAKRDLTIVDDVRFKNEADWVIENGGLLFRVMRPGFYRPPQWQLWKRRHRSERELDNYPHHGLVNNHLDPYSTAMALVVLTEANLERPRKPCDQQYSTRSFV